MERKERQGKHDISFSTFGEFVVRYLVLWGVKENCAWSFV